MSDSLDLLDQLGDFSNLPAGWAVHPIGELGRIVGGGTPKATDPANFAESGGTPWLTPADLTGYRDKYILRGRRNLSELGLRSSSAVPLPPGTVLFSSRAPIGYIAISAGQLATNQGFRSIIPGPRVSADYLYHYLRFAKPIAEHLASGTTFAEISGSGLAKVPVILPPIATQAKLVEKVEALNLVLRSSSDRLATIPALLKKFRQSVLAAACSGQLTADWREGHSTVEPVERLLARIRQHRKSKPISSPPAMDEDVPRDWVLTTVGQICAVATGATPLRTKSVYFGGDIPWITSSAVNDGTVTRASQFITELAVKETNAKVFPPGTLIVAMYGEGQTRGRVAELGIATATNQALAALLFDDVNEYCRAFVKLHFLKNYEEMRNLAAGGVQPNLSLGLIRDSELLLPPLDEQAEIVRRVESLFALADSIESRLAEATNQVERTTQAILAKAFRGELIE